MSFDSRKYSCTVSYFPTVCLVLSCFLRNPVMWRLDLFYGYSNAAPGAPLYSDIPTACSFDCVISTIMVLNFQIAAFYFSGFQDFVIS